MITFSASYVSKKVEDKDRFLNHFTRQSWYGLSMTERKSHSFHECSTCRTQPNHRLIYQLLRKNNQSIKHSETKVTPELQLGIILLAESKTPASAQAAVKDIVAAADSYNDTIHGKENMDTARANNPPDQEKMKRILKSVGKEITERYNKAILKNNKSYRGMANVRRDTTLEDKDNTKKSVINHERFDFNRQAVKEDIVKTTESGKKPVWLDLARRFPVKRPDGELAKNANEVIKMFAISEGLHQPAIIQRTRRGKRKIEVEGVEVDLTALFPTDQALKTLTREKIAAGIIDIGQPVVPITLRYKKITNGKIETVTVTMYGRAYPLQTIMDKTLRDHSKEGFLRPPFPPDYDINVALTELAAKGMFNLKILKFSCLLTFIHLSLLNEYLVNVYYQCL